MDRSLFEARFYETYYFASAIKNILHDRYAYLRLLDDFYGEDRYLPLLQPYRRYSAFHYFINFIVSDMINDQIDDSELLRRQNEYRRFETMPLALSEMKPWVLPIEEAFQYYDFEYLPFRDWLKESNKTFLEATSDDVYEFYESLQVEGPLDELLYQAVQETFYIVFQNRPLLLLFNDIVSEHLKSIPTNDIPESYKALFNINGTLKRHRIPEWAKRAAFYRDKGMCVICNCDLSGMLNVSNKVNYDHIVPLAQGGLNDVSNLQLLCAECNHQKTKGDSYTSHYYQIWYPMLEHEK